jgi:succinate dehydrogenase / fumarate reductase membrane anchor subunit
MATQFGRSSRSSAFQWFLHRITGTFLVFLLITHFWVQHYDRTTASISHSVVTAADAEAGVLPEYRPEAEEAVRAFKARERQPDSSMPRVVPAAQDGASVQRAPAPAPASAAATPYDVLMLRLGDPVYAVLWKGFNLLFLIFALHHGFYGLNNILTDYVRHDMTRVGLSALSWTLALVLFLIGAYSVIVAGL